MTSELQAPDLDPRGREGPRRFLLNACFSMFHPYYNFYECKNRALSLFIMGGKEINSYIP